jgi:hypothetical protein
MDELVLFLAARFLSKSFWLLVLSTFFGVLLFAMRSYYRNEVFQDATKASWRMGRGNANRF